MMESLSMQQDMQQDMQRLCKREQTTGYRSQTNWSIHFVFSSPVSLVFLPVAGRNIILPPYA